LLYFMRLKRIASALTRHAVAYNDLVVAAAAEWKTAALRRAALALIGVTLGTSAIVIAAAWLLFSFWDSPGRNWIAAALVLVLAAGAFAALRTAASASPGPRQQRLRAEWQQDMAVMTELRNRTAS
jgi:uncharacterized membrane protein YqjE